MTDERDLFDRTIRRWSPPQPSFDRLLLRRDHKRRNRRIGSAVVALIVTAVVAVALSESFRSGRPVPAISPTPLSQVRNGRVAFVSPGEGAGFDRLYTAGPNGTGLRQITTGNVEYPVWSPDGSTIAFDDGSVIAVRDWSAANGHIYSVKADGTGLTQVTSGGGAEFTPVWSPDGTHMAVSAEGQSELPAGISIVDMDTGRLSPLTANPYPGYMDKEPGYSPDGERIVFVRDRQLVEAGAPRNLSALFVVNVDGTGLRRLTTWELAVRTPSWSPDGSRILFASGDLIPPRGGRRAQVFVIGADGSGLRQLTSSATAVAFWPSWSPDGSRIVFTRWTFAPRRKGFELYTMRPDGSHITSYTPAPLQEANSADWGTHP
ncbi:MAG: hypothetical protein ACJ77A_07595 [Actinomycetota bacterium]